MSNTTNQSRKRDRGRNFPKTKPTKTKQFQQKMNDYYEHHVNGVHRYERFLEAAGDPLEEKAESSIRFIFQNINGLKLNDGFEVAPEITAIGALQADVAGYAEINSNATNKFQDRVRSHMQAHLGTSRLITSSGKATKDGYLPGGVLQAIIGHHNGRIRQQGSDKWGRFAWHTMLGRRDEGIIVITAYRVCQRKGTRTTARTAYNQQISEMISEGYQNLDPRNQILTDLAILIKEKRNEGYLPILMMDANEEWESTENNQLRQFIDIAQLTDAMRAQHPTADLATYRTGSRTDYIFIDQTLQPAIRSIGQLGMHDGIISDHVMLHMDLDENEVFRGRLHRPVDVQSREFTIEQADKQKKFIEEFKVIWTHQNIAERVVDIAKQLEKHGPTTALIKIYHQIDRDIIRGMLTSAKRSVKKKFGYQRSPALSREGSLLLIWKSVGSAKRCKRQIPGTTLAKAQEKGLNISEVIRMSQKEIKLSIRNARKALWDVQKRDAAARIAWLEGNAKNIATAKGRQDWEKTMATMVQVAANRNMNRKLTSAIKGSRQGLNRIEIPTHEWYYSEKEEEIYRYDDGVFEAHSAMNSETGRYYPHHHLKVLPPDATTAEVEVREECIALLTIYPKSNFWTEITDQKEIERLIMARNKRHLQQVSKEQGLSHHPIMKDIMENCGDNGTADEILNGTYDIPQGTPDAIRAWISSMKRTPAESALPKVTGYISREQFQSAFKKTKEFTSSSPSGAHYTLWKSIANDNDLAEFLCMMMSLPFMYGFTNERWTNCVDVMLEKSKGERKIHQL